MLSNNINLSILTFILTFQNLITFFLQIVTGNLFTKITQLLTLIRHSFSKNSFDVIYTNHILKYFLDAFSYHNQHVYQIRIRETLHDISALSDLDKL